MKRCNDDRMPRYPPMSRLYDIVRCNRVIMLQAVQRNVSKGRDIELGNYDTLRCCHVPMISLCNVK